MRKNSKSLPGVEPEARGRELRENWVQRYRKRRWRFAKRGAVIADANDAGADEQQRHSA